MSLPKSIQRQLKEASAIEDQLRQAAENPPPSEPTIQATIAAANPPNEPTSAPVAQAPAQAPAPAPAAPAAPPTEDWRHKFLTLQGIFNAEVPKLQHQNKELLEQMQDLRRKVETAATKPPEPTQPDPKDVDAFGVDMVNMVRRVADQLIGDIATSFDARLRGLEAKLMKMEPTVEGSARTSAAAAEETFYLRLTQLVPGWQQTNIDPRFLQWLADVDPVYGLPRKAALDSAAQNKNAEHAASVFNAFTSQLPPAPPPNPLESQQTPAATGGSPPPAQPNAPVLTQKQVAAFYNDVARGRFKGREAEQQQIENIINLAAVEGRIRP